MGTDLLRPHDVPRGRVPAGEPRPNLPAKAGRSKDPARHARHPRRPADDASAGAPSPSSPLRPLRCNIDNHATPGRSRRRSRFSLSEGQVVAKVPVRNLVMEEVTILKRGEEVRRGLPAADPRLADREGTAAEVEAVGDYLALCSTKRLGPDPEILPRQMRLMEEKNVLYAGAGFFTSPSPRSLPLPTAFFAKKEVVGTTDLATRGVRYLRRLDLP